MYYINVFDGSTKTVAECETRKEAWAWLKKWQKLYPRAWISETCTPDWNSEKV